MLSTNTKKHEQTFEEIELPFTTKCAVITNKLLSSTNLDNVQREFENIVERESEKNVVK